MKTIDKIYINGEFVTPKGTQIFDLINPTNNIKEAQVVLGNEEDVKDAVSAAQKALVSFSQSTKEERIQYLERLRDAVANRLPDLIDIMVKEYGGTFQFSSMALQFSIDDFNAMIDVLKEFEFQQNIGKSKVNLQPVGVVGVIIPWNMSNGFICTKVASAIAAGCPVVIKASELSAQQTQILAECVHAANLPKGIINFVNGLGDVVGAEITRNPGISKITFTGSTNVGKIIAKGAVETMKRVTLELGGKSPNIILDDANLEEAIPTAVIAAFLNSGQACAAATRLIVPKSKLQEVNNIVKSVVENMIVGDPSDPKTAIGPMVNQKQYERVLDYIRIGQEEGATLLIGGSGKPEGLEAGNYVTSTQLC